jgi:uncharacterized membrane protein
MLIILFLTLWAMVENLAGFISNEEWLLVALSGIILGLTAWLTLSSLSALLGRLTKKASKQS